MSAFFPIYQLLLGIGTLLLGMGLLGTLLALRAGLEGFSVVTTGVVMSCYFVGYVLGGFLCPPLIRRVGHIRAFAAMAAVTSATIIAHGLVVHSVAWAILRVITGLNMIGIYMTIESWLNILVPNQFRGRLFAIYMTVTLLALAFGQYLILVGDLGSLVPFALAAMLLTLGLVPVALTNVPQPQPLFTPSRGLSELYRISPLSMVGVFVTGLICGAFWGMGPVFGVRVGLSDTGVAAFMSSFVIGGALLQWPIGRLSDRFDRRRVLIGIAFLGTLLALAVFAVAPVSHFWMIITAFFCGGTFFSSYSLNVAYLNDHLSPSEVVDATGSLLIVYGVGTAVSPLAASLTMQILGPGSLFLYCGAALATLTVYGLYRMLTVQPVPREEQGEFVPMVRTSPEALEMHPGSPATPNS